MTQPIRDPRVGRQRTLVLFLRAAAGVTLLAAVVELLLPEHLAATGGWVMLAVLIGTPLVRVVWLGVRWARRGDWRFAAVAGLLLAVVTTGYVVR